MTETIATLDAVREAMGRLRNLGEKPTFSKIRELVGGGSKSTILKHMNAIFQEIASSRSGSQLPMSFLAAAAEPMIKRLWDRAESAASREYQTRIQQLFDINSAMAEELKTALNRAEEAERLRSEALDSLKARDEAEFHLDTLSELIRTMQNVPDEPAKLQLLRILGESEGAVHKDEFYRRMRMLGYQDMAIYQARYHADKSKLISDSGKDMYELTVKGRQVLERAA